MWTTLFVFVFDAPSLDPEAAFVEISARLRNLEARTLLFLKKIKEIEYKLPDETGGVYLRPVRHSVLPNQARPRHKPFPDLGRDCQEIEWPCWRPVDRHEESEVGGMCRHGRWFLGPDPRPGNTKRPDSGSGTQSGQIPALAPPWVVETQESLPGLRLHRRAGSDRMVPPTCGLVWGPRSRGYSSARGRQVAAVWLESRLVAVIRVPTLGCSQCSPPHRGSLHHRSCAEARFLDYWRHVGSIFRTWNFYTSTKNYYRSKVPGDRCPFT